MKKWLTLPVAAMASGVGLTFALTSMSPAKAANPCIPRVAGVSYSLDIVQTGARVGPSITYGIVQTVAGQALPGGLGAAQQQLLAAGAKTVVVVSQAGPQGVENLRAGIAPLAALNPRTDAGLSAIATATNGSVTQFGSTIAPLDVPLKQVGAIAQSNEEPASSCSN
jgi:hypothetical protein